MWVSTGLKALWGELGWLLASGVPRTVPNQPELDVTLVQIVADRCHSVVCVWGGGLMG